MKFVKHKTVSLKAHQDMNEAWLQDVIADDPSIIGIGDVVLKDKERIQPGAGRLDLLFQEAEGNGRFEVEIQLGASDESHIIRTIEYWDIERRKYPQYDHTAVIIAEDITSRFLNVISLFNGFIPIMAIQVTAIQMSEDTVGLQFTKILDTLKLGLLDDDEQTAEPTDRAYWENRASKKTVKLVDEVLALAKVFASSAEMNFNKHYIGFRIDGKSRNFAVCRPRRKAMRLSIKLANSTENEELIANADIDLDQHKHGWYEFNLNDGDIEKNGDVLSNLLKQAYDLH